MSRNYAERLSDQVHGRQFGQDCGLHLLFAVHDPQALLERKLGVELEVEVVVLGRDFIALEAVLGPEDEVHLVGEVLPHVVDLYKRADRYRLPKPHELLFVDLHKDLHFVYHGVLVVQLGQQLVP